MEMREKLASSVRNQSVGTTLRTSSSMRRRVLRSLPYGLYVVGSRDVCAYSEECDPRRHFRQVDHVAHTRLLGAHHFEAPTGGP